jgi:hypothetical protein
VPTEEPWTRTREPITRTLVRNVTIAIVVGVAISLARRAPLRFPVVALLALWPSLGGHFVEIAFLDIVRPRLPRSRLVQASARLVWWLAGGALLCSAMITTAQLLSIGAPPWHWWWRGPPIFVGIELTVHAALTLRERPSFYRGDG